MGKLQAIHINYRVVGWGSGTSVKWVIIYGVRFAKNNRSAIGVLVSYMKVRNRFKIFP